MSVGLSPRRRGAGELALVLAPALLVLILLVPFIGRDLAGGVTASNAPYSDEGFVTLNPRNWALFGQFAVDEWAAYLLTVPYSVIEAFVLRVAGVGLIQARLVETICIALTTVIVGASLRRPFGLLPAVVSATAFATSSLVLYYGRSALIEPMAGLFLVSGTLTLLGIDGSRPGRSGLLGGVLLALALGAKAVTAPAVAGVLLVALVAVIRVKPARRWLAAALAVLALAALTWALLFWLPNTAAVADVRDKIYPHLPPLTGWRLVSRLVTLASLRHDAVAVLAAPLLVAAIAGVVVTIVRRSARTPSTTVLVAACASAAIAADVGLAVAGYRPNRYLVPELPLLAVLIAPAARAVLDAVASAGNRAGARGSLYGAGAALALIVLLGAQGLLLHLSWMRNAGSRLTEAQAVAAAEVPDDAVVAGLYGPLLAMTTRAHILLNYGAEGGVNAGDLYAKGARWWADDHPPDWASDHPEAWAAAQPVTCLDPWTVKMTRVCLWRLP